MRQKTSIRALQRGKPNDKSRWNYETAFILVLILICIGIAIACGGGSGEIETGEVVHAFYAHPDHPDNSIGEYELAKMAHKWTQQTIDCFIERGAITEEQRSMIPIPLIKLVEGQRSKHVGCTLIISIHWFSEQRAFVVRHEMTECLEDVFGGPSSRWWFNGDEQSHCQANELY